MEEILASIRRIISDEEAPESGESAAADKKPAEPSNDTQKAEASDDMGDSTEMSQDDLDKLFDMDGDDDAADTGDDADDMAAAMAADAAEDELPDDAGDDDILELTEDLEVGEDDDEIEMVGGMAEDLEGDDADIAFVEEKEDEPEPEPAPELTAPPPPSYAKPIPDTDFAPMEKDAPLTSDETGHAVHAALDSFSDMLISSQAQTIEELVREMLRPMLKAWLDQNLPPMVEEMVKKEIQRVIRRR